MLLGAPLATGCRSLARRLPLRWAPPAAARPCGLRYVSAGRGGAAGGGKRGRKAVELAENRRRHVRDTRQLPVLVLAVHGRGGGGGADGLAEEYAGKIRRYCPFEEARIASNPKNSSVIEVQTESEGERVMKLLDPRDHVVILDERGKDLTSEAFAALVADAGDRGAGRLVFCVGGPFGHGPQVHARADQSVRLSRMVLNHQVARVVLYEQIYRAWTILRGESYHH